MKYSGMPALAVAGTCGSIELEKSSKDLRKGLKKPAEVAKENELVRPIVPPVKQKGSELPPRFTVKDFVSQHLGK
jgi:hypothetical protein